jgi:uncharacterized protein YndB with AHSA1/START domain
MHEVRVSVELEATPEEVWHAVTTSDGLATWFQPMPMEERPPGRRMEIDLGSQAFVYEIDSDPTVLHFTHRMEEDLTEQFQPGWEMYFFTMQQYFRHFRGLPALYAEAEGPALSASADAWPAVVAAAKELDGEIDYESASFLGVRTADSLIRFHGRWMMDMPVAVSEHAYGGAEPRDWAPWLAEVLGP